MSDTSNGPLRSVGALHQELVEQHAPPSVLLDAKDKVVHVSEHAGRYLRVPGGNLTTNVINMVREEFRLELPAALNEARQKRTTVRSEPVALKIDGAPWRVVLHVRSVAKASSDQEFTLVVFDGWE